MGVAPMTIIRRHIAPGSTGAQDPKHRINKWPVIFCNTSPAPFQELVEKCQDFFQILTIGAELKVHPRTRLQALAGAIEWALEKQKSRADKASGQKARKVELNYYTDLVTNLSRAFALASASDYAQSVKNEVGFFQAVRAALSKSSPKTGISRREKEFAIGQLISDAIAEASIIDVLAAAGMRRPEISVLSEEFLVEIQNMEQKNLALETLRKLLAGEIKARQQRNVVVRPKLSRSALRPLSHATTPTPSPAWR